MRKIIKILEEKAIKLAKFNHNNLKHKPKEHSTSDFKHL